MWTFFSLLLKSWQVVRKAHMQIFQLGHIHKLGQDWEQVALTFCTAGTWPIHTTPSPRERNGRLRSAGRRWRGDRPTRDFSRSDPTSRLPVFPSPPHPGRSSSPRREREGKTQNPSAHCHRPVADGHQSREMAVDEVNSVYVGGLPYEANEEMLRDAFGYYGTIVSVKVRPAPPPLLSV